MYISVINGPNLNLLGKREPGIYGHTTLERVIEKVRSHVAARALVRAFQSNSEGALVDELQTVGFDPECAGIILNAGAYTHTSLALADAIAAVPARVIEVHISNIQAREPIRHHSMLTPVCAGIIAGLGVQGYILAADALLKG